MSAVINELRLLASGRHVSALVVPVLEDAADTIARLEQQRDRLAAALRAVRPTIESLDEMGDCDRCGVVVGWAVSEELLAQIDAALREVEGA